MKRKQQILAKLGMLSLGIMLGLNLSALISKGMTIIVMAMLGVVMLFEFIEGESFRQLVELMASTVLGVELQMYFATPIEFSVLITIMAIVGIVAVIMVKNIVEEAGAFHNCMIALRQKFANPYTDDEFVDYDLDEGEPYPTDEFGDAYDAIPSDYVGETSSNEGESIINFEGNTSENYDAEDANESGDSNGDDAGDNGDNAQYT